MLDFVNTRRTCEIKTSRIIASYASSAQSQCGVEEDVDYPAVDLIQGCCDFPLMCMGDKLRLYLALSRTFPSHWQHT
jgi:hypothetical protein